MITSDQLSLLPKEPGVYIMKNARGDVVYVGKAIDIQKRVRSHCRRSGGQYASPFVESVHRVDTTITDNEVEALLLEYNREDIANLKILKEILSARLQTQD